MAEGEQLFMLAMPWLERLVVYLRRCCFATSFKDICGLGNRHHLSLMAIARWAPWFVGNSDLRSLGLKRDMCPVVSVTPMFSRF